MDEDIKNMEQMLSYKAESAGLRAVKADELKRATLGQRESHAQGEIVRPSERKAILAELRTDKQSPLQDAVNI